MPEMIHTESFEETIKKCGGLCQFSRERLQKFLEFGHTALLSSVFYSENGYYIVYTKDVEKTLEMLKNAIEGMKESKTDDPSEFIKELVLSIQI